MEDAELVAFCRSEYPRLVGSLGLYCGNAAVAEELANETLAWVWTSWKNPASVGLAALAATSPARTEPV